MFCPDNYESGSFADHICEAMHERLCFACLACSDAKGTRIYVFAEVGAFSLRKSEKKIILYTCTGKKIHRFL